MSGAPPSSFFLPEGPTRAALAGPGLQSTPYFRVGSPRSSPSETSCWFDLAPQTLVAVCAPRSRRVPRQPADARKDLGKACACQLTFSELQGQVEHRPRIKARLTDRPFSPPPAPLPPVGESVSSLIKDPPPGARVRPILPRQAGFIFLGPDPVLSRIPN